MCGSAGIAAFAKAHNGLGRTGNGGLDNRATMKSYEESRRHARVKVDIYVPWGWTEECPYNDRITSLSAGGCFIQTKRKAQPDGIVYLRLWMPDERTLTGELRYCLEKVGVGVEFKGLSDAEHAVLKGLVADYAQLLTM
jgi:hypothetical protein